MPLDYRHIPAFCINLERRLDRWALAAQEFARLGLSVTRWPGVEYTASPYPALRPGQAGCLDSHKQIWRHVLENGWPAAMIFEDDVIFSSDFKDIFSAAALELPGDWDVWSLHATHAQVTLRVQYVAALRGSLWGTHGYLVSPRGCTRLLALPDDQPVDYRISPVLTDCGGAVYGIPVERAIVFQRGGEDSDIQVTDQNDFWRRQRARYCR
jgi:glycosyl transferase family 25